MDAPNFFVSWPLGDARHGGGGDGNGQAFPREIEAALKLYFPSGPKPWHLAASIRSRRQPIR